MSARTLPATSAYAGLMTDHYPPFRLDQGGPDPGSVPGAEAAGVCSTRNAGLVRSIGAAA
jgi:hypothetical protein